MVDRSLTCNRLSNVQLVFNLQQRYYRKLGLLETAETAGLLGVGVGLITFIIIIPNILCISNIHQTIKS